MNLNKIDASVDFLRCHGATRNADRGQWCTESGEELGSDPLVASESLRRELHRRSFETDKKRWMDGGRIGG